MTMMVDQRLRHDESDVRSLPDPVTESVDAVVVARLADLPAGHADVLALMATRRDRRIATARFGSAS